MKKTAVGLLLVLLAGCAQAHLASGNYNYVSPDVISPEFLPAPIPAHSAEWDKEIHTIIALQKHSTEQDKLVIADEKNLRPELLTAVLGDGYTRARFPKTYVLLDKAGSDCRVSMENAKAYWHTTRPYLSDSHVKAFATGATNGSYPSGHTACSLVWAEVLGQLMPEKRQALLERAFAIGDDRVVAGVHYPDDIAGGHALGYMLFGALQQSPAYMDDKAAAAAELRQQ